MNETSTLIKITAVIVDRKFEFIKFMQKHLTENGVDFEYDVLKEFISKMNSKYFLTKSEFQNKKISFHTRLDNIIKDNPMLVQNICKQIDEYSNK